MTAILMLGLGLLTGWLVFPLGYLLVACGAWRLRDQTHLAYWLLVASLAAGLGQMANWPTDGSPWSFGSIAGVITEVLVCTILIGLAPGERTRARARILRLALPVSYVVFGLAWLPTRGALEGPTLSTAVLVVTLVINLGLSLALVSLLLSGRSVKLREQAGNAH